LYVFNVILWGFGMVDLRKLREITKELEDMEYDCKSVSDEKEKA
jgi:hypothetical protein